MRSSVAQFIAALLCACVSLSARAAPPDAQVLTAPQLMVAGPGPVTATFLGASQPFAQLFFAWESASGASAQGFFFGAQTTAGSTFEISAEQSPLSPFAAGSDVTFATLFGNPLASSALLSSTAATSGAELVLTAPVDGEPAPGIVFNAGVVASGAASVLIGFNPAGSPVPSGIDGFAVRISVSNICAG